MASKKKIIGSGVDVQTAAGVSALTVDETTGGTTVTTTAGNIRSGTYTPSPVKVGGTPTITFSAKECRWIRIGNVVNISGTINIQPSAAGYIEYAIDLPADGGGSVFASSQEAAGVIHEWQMGIVGGVLGRTGYRQLLLGIAPSDNSSRDHVFSATYTLKP